MIDTSKRKHNQNTQNTQNQRPQRAHAPVVEEEELHVLGVRHHELVEAVGQQVARVGVGPCCLVVDGEGRGA